jgi:hypothetical protein
MIAAIGGAVRGIIWLIDRQRDRDLIRDTLWVKPERIDDVAKAIERTRKPRWQLPERDRNEQTEAVEAGGDPPCR